MQEPIASLVPALAEASRTVGSPQIRNAGTLGGNLGTCSPAGDGLPVLSALDARVRIVSAAGERTASVHDVMVGVKRTSLRTRGADRRDHPARPSTAGRATPRSACAMQWSSRSRAHVSPSTPTTEQVAIALGSVGPTIIRCTDAEQQLAAAVDWAAIVGHRPRHSTSSPAWSARRADRSPITARPPTTGATRSASSASGWRDGRSRPTEATRMSNEFFTLRVNGTDHEVADSWLGESLLDVLRDRIGLMGSKGACTQGECGSCSVHGRRRARLLLPRDGCERSRPGGRHDRRRRTDRRTERRPAGVRRRRRRPVRLLHTGSRDGGPRPARANRDTDRDRDPRGTRRQRLPLHRVRPDHRRRPAGRRATQRDAERRCRRERRRSDPDRDPTGHDRRLAGSTRRHREGPGQLRVLVRPQRGRLSVRRDPSLTTSVRPHRVDRPLGRVEDQRRRGGHHRRRRARQAHLRPDQPGPARLRGRRRPLRRRTDRRGGCHRSRNAHGARSTRSRWSTTCSTPLLDPEVAIAGGHEPIHPDGNLIRHQRIVHGDADGDR